MSVDPPSITRRDYEFPPLRRADLDPDPIVQFQAWFEVWRSSGPYEPWAMTVATADADGRPSSRYVLCRGVDARGFTFYTNLTSRKAEQLLANPYAALTFGWLEIARQVRVEGRVVEVDPAESDAYWAGRPRASQIGAWASDQSEVLDARADLEDRLAEAEARFADVDPVPRPEGWGGFRVEPEQVELWQGRPNRLHDRFRYARDRDAESGWRIDRLAP